MRLKNHSTAIEQRISEQPIHYVLVSQQETYIDSNKNHVQWKTIHYRTQRNKINTFLDFVSLIENLLEASGLLKHF